MDINVTLDQVIVWVVIGLLAGSLAGMFFKQTQKGLGGLVSKLIIGLMGALLGGFLLGILNLDLGLGDLTIAYEDLLAAIVGSILFLIILSLIKK